jgi:hypothetical protein
MKSIEEVYDIGKERTSGPVKYAFTWALIAGLLTHMSIMVKDIPNHDGLNYIFSSQVNLVAGRWFLAVTNAFSSYHSLHWVDGVMGLFFLAVAAAILVELLQLNSEFAGGVVGALMATFPAVASTFAYVFMLDSYMLAVLLTILAVLLTDRRKKGWIYGMICLMFALGIYQSYLAFAVLLSWYCILRDFASEGELRYKVRKALRFLYMGAAGSALYFIVMKISLAVSGAELLEYQGMDSLNNGFSLKSMLGAIPKMYVDFVEFTVRSKIMVPDATAAFSMGILVGVFFVMLGKLCRWNKWHKKPGFYLLTILTILIWPLGTNVVLLITPDVNYHLIMRFHWVLIPILFLATADRNREIVFRREPVEWAVILSAALLAFNYGLVDNIGYSNLEKRYEKTYAYCLRLLDRIEQTEGYYTGIPVAIVGVVGDESYPSTDLTADVTGSMIGLTGDFLYYTGSNYADFFKYYMGATINLADEETLTELYYNDEYVAMESFPGKTSTKVIDGVLCVKTENFER